jgi:hypothetical protein
MLNSTAVVAYGQYPNFEPYMEERNTVISYNKGEAKSSHFAPIGKMIGFGLQGRVYEYQNQSHLAVKKSSDGLSREHDVGTSLNHPNIVKMGRLFIKEYRFLGRIGGFEGKKAEV